MNSGRRNFLKSSIAAATAAMVPFRSLGNRSHTVGRSTRRASEALRIRLAAAQRQHDLQAVSATSNGDEDFYPNKIASFSKGLPHSDAGEVDLSAYAKLLRALRSGKLADLESVPMGGSVRLVNPQAGLSYTLEGADAQAIAAAPAPRFSSAEQAAEACELYWQAITRDVPFAEYESNPLIKKAAAELGTLKDFHGPKEDNIVTPATLFRGSTSGDLRGPYLSQFLWKEVPWGAVRVVQQVRTATAGIDYLTRWDDWLAVQNGKPSPSRYASQYRYVATARDLAAYVQFDFTYQAFQSACLILFGMQGTTEAERTYRGAPFDSRNPYRGKQCQTGFVTFGVAHVLDLVARVALDALKPCWYQKWYVHRRLRPEEFCGRLHAHKTKVAEYPIDDQLLHSEAVEAIDAKYGCYLLPQAYPEGAPLHPSYPAGHAVIAGACATVLKAFFDESFPIDDPVVSSTDGQHLVPYSGPALMVGGELDKLASNISIGRNAAGIHWRSDAATGMRLGENVALSVMRDMKGCFCEDFSGFTLTTFDGQSITV